MSASTGISFTASKVAVPRRMACPTRSIKASAFQRDLDQGEGVWAQIRSAAPMVCLSAAMLLSSGAAHAASLGPAYGGAVGGSDTLREVVQGGAGKAQALGGSLLNDLPTPNLPTPESVGASNPASSIQGAIDKTVSNVKNTFSEGGDNIKEAGDGLGSKVATGASDIGAKAPGVLQSSAANQAKAGGEAKNVLESGKEALERFVVGGASGPQDAFKSGTDSLQDGANAASSAIKSGADKLQRNTGSPDDLVQAGKAGINKLQRNTSASPGDLFQGGKDKVERAIGNGVKDSFMSGADNLQQDANTVKGSVQGGIGNAVKDLQSTGAPSFGDAKGFFQSAQDAVEGGAKAVQGAADTSSADAPKTFGEAKDKAFKFGADQKNTSNDFFDGSALQKLVGGSAQETFKTGGQDLQNAASDFTGTVKSGLDDAQRNTSSAGNAVTDAISSVQGRADDLNKGVEGVKGLADNVKGNAQEASKQASQTGKSIFGMF